MQLVWLPVDDPILQLADFVMRANACPIFGGTDGGTHATHGQQYTHPPKLK